MKIDQVRAEYKERVEKYLQQSRPSLWEVFLDGIRATGEKVEY